MPLISELPPAEALDWTDLFPVVQPLPDGRLETRRADMGQALDLMRVGFADVVRASVGVIGLSVLRALPLEDRAESEPIWLAGYRTAGDGGQGRFRWNPASGAPDNGGTVIAPIPTPDLGRWVRDDDPGGRLYVTQFGAVTDGSENTTAAFAAAYAAAPEGGAIVVPPGRYAMTAPTGTKRVLWITNGATNLAGTGLISGVLPGLQETMFQGRKLIQHPNAGATDFASVEVQRRPTYTSGSGGVNSGFRVSTITLQDQGRPEWCITTVMENYTNQDSGGGGRVGVYCRSIKYQAAKGAGNATSPTWAGTFEMDDRTVDPTRGSFGIEVDVFANGTDANNRRVGIDLIVGKSDDNGDRPTVGYGLRIGPQNGNQDNGRFARGIFMQGEFGSGLVCTGTGDRFINQTGAWNYGLDLSSGSYAQAAIRIPSDTRVTFNTAGTQGMRWDDANFRFEFLNNSTVFFSVNNVGRTNTLLEYRVADTRVVGKRRTGWTDPSGTLNRGTFNPATVTLEQLAQRVAALITDMRFHGLIGA